ncbi:MAG: hypothetical protein PHW72_01240 [Candidatus Pacebacteria bacterium]|nr:hypothetical protein [Candidatus Paceibacterota bacterium]
MLSLIMKFLNRFNLFQKKPKIIMISGEQKSLTKEFVGQVLGQRFEIGKDVMLYDVDLNDSSQLKSLVNASEVAILVADRPDGLDPLPFTKGFIIYKEKKSIKVLALDSGKEFNLEASNVMDGEKLNFKIKYAGSLVPVWIGEEFSDDKISAVLLAAGVGLSLGLNLVEVSQALKPAEARNAV